MSELAFWLLAAAGAPVAAYRVARGGLIVPSVLIGVAVSLLAWLGFRLLHEVSRLPWLDPVASDLLFTSIILSFAGAVTGFALGTRAKSS